MFVIGRGVEFATAREIALKLLETCRIAAEPLTTTDLAHGPVAALDPLFPVWAIASDDGTLAPCRRPRRGPERWARPSSRAGPQRIGSRARPTRCPCRTRRPRSSPLLSVVPGQLLRWALARARGLDPDAPHGLAKVTLARGRRLLAVEGLLRLPTRSRNDSIGKPGPGSQWSLRPNALLTSAWPVIPRRSATRSSARSQRTGIACGGRRRRRGSRRARARPSSTRPPSHAGLPREPRRARRRSSACCRRARARRCPSRARTGPRCRRRRSSAPRPARRGRPEPARADLGGVGPLGDLHRVHHDDVDVRPSAVVLFGLSTNGYATRHPLDRRRPAREHARPRLDTDRHRRARIPRGDAVPARPA